MTGGIQSILVNNSVKVNKKVVDEIIKLTELFDELEG